ncbi:hypothetical protein BLA29_006421 [Euroglyphus maynei]|uniref:Uncharacterized protein n=1 Tax=Euroglyphus maynei TaxID=6958 RepID=A0A1Y3B3K9_EURMA|nr:hypothetical protein BLA29_006421 [Euroglyphus maynei]
MYSVHTSYINLLSYSVSVPMKRDDCGDDDFYSGIPSQFNYCYPSIDVDNSIDFFSPPLL